MSERSTSELHLAPIDGADHPAAIACNCITSIEVEVYLTESSSVLVPFAMVVMEVYLQYELYNVVQCQGNSQW